ncbi:MAG: energy transducer TonB [Acidobacteriota bacterium]|nr:energy transducer TonB [Acidobacteriota bacterium]
MKLRKKAVVNFACALALASNSLGVMAQDKQQTQTQTQNKVIVKIPDGQTKEYIVKGDSGVLVDQNGQQIRINRTTQGDGQQLKVMAGPEAGVGGVVSFTTQGGVTTTSQGQDFVFVRGQGESGQGATFNFVSSEMSFENKLVKGAPFSAEIENETVQTLGDGNRIVHKSDGSIHRDGEGRMRREQSIGAVGSFANSENFRTITLTDPVAGAIYTLEPNSHIARKMSNVRTPMPTLSVAGGSTTVTSNTSVPKKISVSGGVLLGNAIKKPQPGYPPVAKAAKASGPVQVQITISEEGKVIDAQVISGHPLLRDAALDAARQWEFKPTELSGAPVKVQGTLTFNFTLAEDKTAGPNALPATAVLRESSGQMMASGMKINSNTESLGKQTIEGIEAEGKRTTTTIPAGAIGNERPIEMVNETWYSPELQTTIMNKRSDPRIGETTFRLTNIHRGEPEASLFQVPSDYTIKEGGVSSSTSSTFNYRVAKPDNQ